MPVEAGCPPRKQFLHYLMLCAMLLVSGLHEMLVHASIIRFAMFPRYWCALTQKDNTPVNVQRGLMNQFLRVSMEGCTKALGDNHDSPIKP